MTLNSLFKDKKILFVNAIRSDVASGGNTSTERLLSRIFESNRVKQVSLQPYTKFNSLGNIFFLALSFPAPFFILLNRLLKKAWLEYFIRFSPVFFIYIIFLRLLFRPQYVFLNQHASFIYSLLFLGVRKVYIWHDLPSLKKSQERKSSCENLLASTIEHIFLKDAYLNITFSFEDQNFIRRFHKASSFIAPVVENISNSRNKAIDSNKFLFVGNWNRSENYDGVCKFLTAYYKLCILKGHPVNKISFHIAGNGAVNFFNSIRKDFDGLPIDATDKYIDLNDFDEVALLAPILRGAGIKLKTIEAWSFDFPVIGTRQAFSGIPKDIWRAGGVVVNNVEELALLCYNSDDIQIKLKELRPLKAFQMYQSKVQLNDIH